MSDIFKLEQQKEGLPSVWMYGGGRQSVCIAQLIIQGKLPQPDIAVIANTGREKKSTFDYLEKVVQPALPFTIHIVPKSEFATVDLWGGSAGKTLLIPAYTNENGTVGKFSNFCSNEWKVRVVERWLARRGVKAFQSWVGFSLNESRRWLKIKKSQGFYVRLPLVDDVPMTADQCVESVMRSGWPNPKHSACWFCPNMQDEEWMDLPADEFQKAVQEEREIQKIDPHAFLHKQCVPLDQVKFSSENKPAIPCDSGVCFV